jgi:hypothetical protein
MSSTLHCAVQALHQAGRDYPKAWLQFDELRARRGALGDWPEYVFCPLAGAYAIASDGTDLPIERGGDVARLGALGAWRPSQGIYRFAPALLEALWATPVTGDLPGELLRRLPEWCVYVELGQRVGDLEIRGVWVHLDLDLTTRQEELRLLLDLDSGLMPVPVPLVGTLEDSLAELQVSTRASMVARGASDLAARETVHSLKDFLPTPRTVAEPIVSVALYLCSVNAELRTTGHDRRPTRPTLRVDKHGRTRCYAAEQPTLWETGVRLGAALAAAASSPRASAVEDQSIKASSPRSHIRRAHWHSYWVGAHESRERRRELRWLPPIPVNLDEGDAPDLATIRPVTPRRE